MGAKIPRCPGETFGFAYLAKYKHAASRIEFFASKRIKFNNWAANNADFVQQELASFTKSTIKGGLGDIYRTWRNPCGSIQLGPSEKSWAPHALSLSCRHA